MKKTASPSRRVEYHFERLIYPFVAVAGYLETITGVAETVQSHASFTSVSQIVGGLALTAVGGLKMREEHRAMTSQEEVRQERREHAAREIISQSRIYDYLADENRPT